MASVLFPTGEFHSLAIPNLQIDLFEHFEQRQLPFAMLLVAHFVLSCTVKVHTVRCFGGRNSPREASLGRFGYESLLGTQVLSRTIFGALRDPHVYAEY